MNNNKICIITLGCSKNLVDSENILGGIKQTNLEIVERPKDANTIIVNTCGFLDTAREESIDVILEASQFKKNGQSLSSIFSLQRK